MRLTRLLFVITILLAALACIIDNPLSSPDTSAIKLNINLPRGESIPDMGTELAKAMAITSVTVTVTADDMEDIEESLDINGETASGTLKVPRGDDRIFAVTCKDANGILQYSGSDTTNILEKSETVTIITAGHYPEAVDLTIGTVRLWAVELSWPQNNDEDFDAYEVVRAGTDDDLYSSSTRESIVTITSKTTTTYTDDPVSPDTPYYYAVIVRDTEGMSTIGAPDDIQLVEIAYDDGNPESGYYWTGGGCAFLNFLSLSEPAKLVGTRFYLTDVSMGGEFLTSVFVPDAGGDIDIRGAETVEANTTGWFDVSYPDSNITMERDFWVVMMWDGINLPCLGADDVDNDRAEAFNGVDLWSAPLTLFMRAVVELPGGVQKELRPSQAVAYFGTKPLLNPALLAPLMPTDGPPVKGTMVKKDR